MTRACLIDAEEYVPADLRADPVVDGRPPVDERCSRRAPGSGEAETGPAAPAVVDGAGVDCAGVEDPEDRGLAPASPWAESGSAPAAAAAAVLTMTAACGGARREATMLSARLATPAPRVFAWCALAGRKRAITRTAARGDNGEVRVIMTDVSENEVD